MTRTHNAYGTGLEFDTESNSFSVVDENLPSWTESQWDATGMRIFQVSGGGESIMAMVVGTGVTLACGILLYYFDFVSWL
jgi:hypothetical protein